MFKKTKGLKRILALTVAIVMLFGFGVQAEDTGTQNGGKMAERFLKSVEESLDNALSEIDVETLDEKMEIKGLDSSGEVTVSKEFVFIVIIAAILLLALCVILIAIATGNSRKVKKLEKDKKMYEEEDAKRSIREEQLARRLMENQKRAHDEKWLRQRAIIEDNKRRAALQQAKMDEKRQAAARAQLIDVLKKINGKKRLEALCMEQDRLLEEQPWLRADRD